MRVDKLIKQLREGLDLASPSSPVFFELASNTDPYSKERVVLFHPKAEGEHYIKVYIDPERFIANSSIK